MRKISSGIPNCSSKYINSGLFPAKLYTRMFLSFEILGLSMFAVIFRDGVLKPTQMGTQSMSMAVSELFWKMVRETVEQQADAFKGQTCLFNTSTMYMYIVCNTAF